MPFFLAFLSFVTFPRPQVVNTGHGRGAGAGVLPSDSLTPLSTPTDQSIKLTVPSTGVYRFHAEPSGTFYRYDAKAIGSGSEGAQAELQNEFHKSLTLAEAETLVLKTLKQVMEEKLDAKNVQLASVTRDKGFRIHGDKEMADVVARLPTN